MKNPGHHIKRAQPTWAKMALAALLLVFAVGRLSVVGATTNVVVTGGFPNYAFSPKVVTVHAGDKVIWTGLGSIHSVTGDTAPESMCGSAFPGSCTNIFTTPGRFLYHCINHVAFGMTGVVNVAAATLPPSVSLDAPVPGTVYAEPALVTLSASVTNSNGSVTNVEFFNNGNLVGSVAAPPFRITAGPLAAGAFAFAAKAIATSGLAGTSAPVNISVVTPVTISNLFPRLTNGLFVFDHTANPGLRYLVQNSTNLVDWLSVATNTAASDRVEVIDSFSLGGLRFYRVGLLPNP